MAKKAHKQQASALDELTSNSEGAWLDSADPPRLEGMRRRNFIAGSRSALRRQSSMQRLDYGRLIVGLVALAVVIGVSWIALEYLVPSPPSSVTIATGGKGTTFDYFGERYRARFARAGIEMNVRVTDGALENLRLLQDSKSNVQIAFTTGGISNRTQAPELLSMGLISNVPFWIFYPSSQSLDSLTQLKGKRIAVGPEGSGARYVAERILSRAKIDAKTATLLPLAGHGAVEALKDATADVALLVGGSDAPSVESC